MLIIHSFLQGMKNRIQNGSEECFKFCLLLVACTIAAITLVFHSEGLSGKSNKTVIEAYAKTIKVEDIFLKTHEETAKEANIRTVQYAEKPQIRTKLNPYEFGAMTGMAETVEKLIVQDKKEENQKEQAGKAKKAIIRKPSRAITLSQAEKEVLLRIVEAEATGEDIKGRMLVANVILNRVKSKQFPDTVKEVVFQRNNGSVQFSPTKDGRYWSVSVSKETKEAVNRVLKGEDYSQGALYFSARSRADRNSMRWFDGNLKWLFKYGGHEFYANR